MCMAHILLDDPFYQLWSATFSSEEGMKLLGITLAHSYHSFSGVNGGTLGKRSF